MFLGPDSYRGAIMVPTFGAQCAGRQQVNQTVEISSARVKANLGGLNKVRFESSLHSLRSAIEFAIKLLRVDSSPAFWFDPFMLRREMTRGVATSEPVSTGRRVPWPRTVGRARCICLRGPHAHNRCAGCLSYRSPAAYPQTMHHSTKLLCSFVEGSVRIRTHSEAGAGGL